jgi:hypothetical protein
VSILELGSRTSFTQDVKVIPPFLDHLELGSGISSTTAIRVIPPRIGLTGIT